MVDERKRTALILGGTGQIGSACARALTAEGWSVLLAHRGAHPAYPALLERDVTSVRVDRDDTARLLELARGHDLVVDTVAYHPGHADQLIQLSGDIGSLVVISTASVYADRNGRYLDLVDERDPATYPDYPVPLREDDPTVDSDETTYSPLKAAMERRLLAADDLPVSILRPGAVHGLFSSTPREWYFLKRALDDRSRVVLSDDGRSRFSTSSVVNIAALVLRCAELPGRRVLNAAEDETLSVSDIARAIFEAAGRRVEVVTFPGVARTALGSTPWSTVSPFVLSMDAARDTVGYRQQVDYRTAVRAEVRWLAREVADREGRGDDWREAFPALVSTMGAESWFGYADEDALFLR